MADSILVERADGVLTATLNRPEKLNALTADMYSALADVVKQAERDDAVGALVITGAGRAFCAGQDLAEFAEPPAGSEELARFIGEMVRTRVNPLILRLRTLEKPAIAAV